MIQIELDAKLDLWQDIISDFIDVVQEINHNLEILIAFCENKGYKQYIEPIKNLELENISQQLLNFRNCLYKIKKYNDSSEIFTKRFCSLIINEFGNANFAQFEKIHEQKKAVSSLITGIKSLPAQFSAQQTTHLNNFLLTYPHIIQQLNNKRTSFDIFDKFKFIDNNIVMIGANGSGKSTFSRNLKNIYSKQITVIPSQQLLFYKAPYHLETNKDYVALIRSFHKEDKLGNESNIKDNSQDDFTNLILALKKNLEDVAKDCYKAKSWTQETILDKVKKVWGKFVNDKTIDFSNYNLVVAHQGFETFDVNSLSDGEKAIIYYAGHIFFAEQSAYIVIDEPENHMHTAMCDKLWNILESERPDCTFIYLTHNLDFAVSRNNKTIIWNKSFTPPNNWDFEELPQDDEIPERLMIELVGSRKDLLFCEGENKSSLDYRLYNSLFDDYTIIPVKTRDDVIRSVIAYNINPALHFKAIGIVDRDNYRDLHSLSKKGIYVLDTNEVENILCDESLVSQSLTHFCSKNSLDTFKEEFFKIFECELDNLAVEYIADYLNDKMHSSFIADRKNLEQIQGEFEKLCEIDISAIYCEHRSYLQGLIKKKDYAEALSYCNLKKRLSRALCNILIVNDYEDRVLEYINKTPEIKEMIINKYLGKIPRNSQK